MFFDVVYSRALELFGGNATLLRWAVIAAVVWLGWGHWGTLLAKAKELLAPLLEKFFKLSPSSVASASKQEDPTGSLVQLTTWAVKSGTDEFLAKVTPLFQELKASQKEKKSDA